MLPQGRYLIFYREVNNGLRIERIMHGARDIDGDAFEADAQGRTLAVGRDRLNAVIRHSQLPIPARHRFDVDDRSGRLH